MAEGEGFEPPDPRGSTVFKTAAIDRSANLPSYVRVLYHNSHRPCLTAAGKPDFPEFSGIAHNRRFLLRIIGAIHAVDFVYYHH